MSSSATPASPAWATGKNRARTHPNNASSSSLVSPNESSEQLPLASSSTHSLPQPASSSSGGPGVPYLQEAPYLTHLQRHHGQITLSAPDNMGRRRQPDEGLAPPELPTPPPKLKKKRKKQQSQQAITPDVLQAVMNAGRPASENRLGGTGAQPRSQDQLRSTRVDMFQDLEMPSEPLPAFSPRTSPSPRPESISDGSATPERAETPEPEPPDYAPRTPPPSSDVEEDDDLPAIIPKYSSRDLWDPMALAWEQDRENKLDLDLRIERDKERREAFEKVERIERERAAGPSTATTSIPVIEEEEGREADRPKTPPRPEPAPPAVRQQAEETPGIIRPLALEADEGDSPGRRIPPPVPPSRRVARTHSVYGGRRFVEAAERRIAAAQARRAAVQNQFSSDQAEETPASPQAAARHHDEPARSVSINSRRMMADAAERRLNAGKAGGTVGTDSLDTLAEEAVVPPPILRPGNASTSRAPPTPPKERSNPGGFQTAPPLPRRPPWTLSNIPEAERVALSPPLQPDRVAIPPSLQPAGGGMSLRRPARGSVPQLPPLNFDVPELISPVDDVRAPEEPVRRQHRPLPVPPSTVAPNRVDAYTAIRERERAAALAALTGQSRDATERRPSVHMRRTSSSSSSLLAPPAAEPGRPASAASSFEQASALTGPRPPPSIHPPQSSATLPIAGPSVAVGADSRHGDEFRPRRSSSAPQPAADTAAPQQQAQQQYTDLDLLLARLDMRENRGESSNNYDDLLVIGEVLGPGQSHSSSDRPKEGLGCTEEEIESLPVARVELVRRRVDKRGRVKLKLSVAGVRCVDCAVCLSQFKADEYAVLLLECLHVFHANCIQSWLRHHRQCPKCRADVFGPRASAST